jgi:hypothetical protein
MKIALTGMPPGFAAYPDHCLSLLAPKNERESQQTFENEAREGEESYKQIICGVLQDPIYC